MFPHSYSRAVFAGGVLLTLTLAGCATPSRALQTSEVAAAVQVRDSRFDAAVEYIGPLVTTHTARGITPDHETWRLRGWRDKATGAMRHQLYVSVWHQDRHARGYVLASFEDGSQASTVYIGYDPNCSGRTFSCAHSETVGVSLTTQQLDAARLGGLAVRLSSRTGPQTVISVPASYVNGYMLSFIR